MRKLILLSLITLLCLPVIAYAASIGGAETQGQGKFAIGLDQEFVFDRDMKKKSVDWQEAADITLTGTMKPEVDKMYRTMVKTSYGVLDNLDIYVKLGTAAFESKYKTSGTWVHDDGINPVETGTWDESVKGKGDNAFAYGFGAKGTYNLKDDWIIGCEAQYLRHKHDLKLTGSLNAYDDTGALVHSETYDPRKAKMTIQEWQIAPYIAKKLGSFIPYLGVKYSDQRGEYKGEEGKEKFKADDNFGVFLGTDYKIGKNFSLNLEGRFVDETAMSFGATYRF